MKTASQIFEEALSGEPLTQESVIEAIRYARQEVYTEILDMLNSNNYSTVTLFKILDKSVE